MWKIMIADNHSAIRNGLKKILSVEPDLEIAAEATSAWELLSKIRNKQFDLLILDIALPGETGIELLAKLRASYSKMPVLVMAIHAEDEFENVVLKEGAAGFIRKENLSNEVVRAIREVLAGRTYLAHACLTS